MNYFLNNQNWEFLWFWIFFKNPELEVITKSKNCPTIIWARDFEQILYTYLHPLLGADQVTGESWQLVTAFHDEGAGLILCKWDTQDHDQTHSCHVVFGFARTNITIVMSSTVIVGVSLIMKPLLPLQSLLHNWARSSSVQEESPLLKDSMEPHAKCLEIGHVIFYTFTCPVLIWFHNMVPNCIREHEVWQYIITMEAAPEIMHIFCSWSFLRMRTFPSF